MSKAKSLRVSAYVWVCKTWGRRSRAPAWTMSQCACVCVRERERDEGESKMFLEGGNEEWSEVWSTRNGPVCA